MMLARPEASTTQPAVVDTSSPNCSKPIAMRIAFEIDLTDARALLQIDAERPRTRGELVLEQAPVELEVVVRREHGRAHLDSLRDVLVTVGGGK